MNGDAHGGPTTLPWGVVFAPQTPAGTQFPKHSSASDMLYEWSSIWAFSLYLWTTRKRPAKDGYTTMRYLLLYSLGRFGVEFCERIVCGLAHFGLRNSSA